jgi:hypothetical protein
MATLAELRKRAKHLGIAPSVIRGADSVKELEGIIADFNSEDAPAKPRKKSAVKKAVKKSAAKKLAAKKSAKKSASSKSAPAKSTKKSGTAKRPTAAKSSKGTDGPTGRHLLNGVNFSDDEGWNARPGSPPDRIVKALKKFRGNREKVFDALVGDVWDFVGKKKRDGSKRTKSDAEAMLRYRISRTAWEFAVRTGQHDAAQDRVEYGTGGTGMGVFKRAKRGGNSKSASKTSTKKSSAKKSAAKKSSVKRSASKRKSASRKR